MQLPDGPQTPPFLQLIDWIARPTQFLEASAKQYGDIFTARWGGFDPFIIISNPQAIQAILTADPKLFDSGRANGILRPLLGDSSLILLDGDRHQRQRKLVTPPFHGERMRTYGELICQITQQTINHWSIDQPFSARTSMQAIALRVILQAVFGLAGGERFQKLEHLLSEMLDAISSPLSSSLLFYPFLQRNLGSWSPWGRFLQRQREIDSLIYAEIQERRVQADWNREDILTLLLTAQDEAGQPMTDVELRDELITLLVAGHETTASALTWALYWIHRLPEVHDKLRQELETLGDHADPTAIARLPYLNAVCQETLRIYPIALLMLPRITKVPFKLMDYEFDANTMLSPCIYLTHQREDLYPEPKQFRPERFLERQFSAYEYMPFGGSSRRCIGMAFAQYEMKLVLATVLSRFQLAIANRRPVQPIRRGVTLAPSQVQMVVTHQHQPTSSPVLV